MSVQENPHSLYVTGLVNARALEVQAIEILSRQVERVETYPELEQLLRTHLKESEQQRDRLDELLASHGTSHSVLKDMVTGFMGNMAAVAHIPMQDEILKNSFANYAFEHFEIASYKALLVMADAAGDTSAPTALNQSLSEEIRTAQALERLLEPTVRQFIALKAQGAQAGI